MALSPTLTYRGLSAFSIEYGDRALLMDPWLEPDWIEGRPDDFDHVDHVLVTHGAHDHLGSAYAVAERSGAQVITEPAVADHLVARGLPEEQLTSVVWGNRVDEGWVEVQALETRHISYFESADGPVSGISLSFHLEVGDVSVYYLGDTAIFGDLKLFGNLYEPDVALVPVGHAPGAFAPLQPGEAALATEWLDVETVVPVHYTPGAPEPDTFADALGERDVAATVARLDPGERLEL